MSKVSIEHIEGTTYRMTLHQGEYNFPLGDVDKDEVPYFANYYAFLGFDVEVKELL